MQQRAAVSSAMLMQRITTVRLAPMRLPSNMDMQLDPNRRNIPCDVFINHRGVDTKRTIAGLLYDRLDLLGLQPFLDNRSMEPGDKLYDCINSAIKARKKFVPIFWDVKPSELQIIDDRSHPHEKIERFRAALHEAKLTVGLTFDSQTGNWSEFVTRATDLIVKKLMEEESS